MTLRIAVATPFVLAFAFSALLEILASRQAWREGRTPLSISLIVGSLLSVATATAVALLAATGVRDALWLVIACCAGLRYLNKAASQRRERQRCL